MIKNLTVGDFFLVLPQTHILVCHIEWNVITLPFLMDTL